MQEKTLLEMIVPAEHVSGIQFASLAQALSATGFCEQENVSDGQILRIAWFDAGKDPKLVRARIAAAVMLAGIPSSRVTVRPVHADWETAWQQDWQAMEIGRRFRVRPAFRPAGNDERIDLVLNPGMAFGTGQHATTQLCLEAIERICDYRVAESMLDMGCGSGLLAIAAVKMGIPHVLAVDNDAIATMATRRNAEVNEVEFSVGLSDVPPAEKFDLVVANILAGPLIAMVSGLSACVGRSLVLSGLLGTQINDVVHAYERAGLIFVRTDVSGEWASLEFESAVKQPRRELKFGLSGTANYYENRGD